MVIGSVIWRRQWRRVCMDSSIPGGSGVDLVGRIEKLVEDLRSSATVARVMSRHLEKLGIRFRITRKAFKDSIAEDRKGRDNNVKHGCNNIRDCGRKSCILIRSPNMYRQPPTQSPKPETQLEAQPGNLQQLQEQATVALVLSTVHYHLQPADLLHPFNEGFSEEVDALADPQMEEPPGGEDQATELLQQ